MVDFFIDDDEGTNEAQITQQALVDTKEKLGALLDMMPTGLIIHQKHSMLYANKRALELLDIAPQTVSGAHFLDFVGQDVGGNYFSLFLSVFEQKDPVRLPELDLKVGTDDEKALQVTAGLLPWEGNSVIQILLEDVSEVKAEYGDVVYKISPSCQELDTQLSFLNDKVVGVFSVLAKALELKKQVQNGSDHSVVIAGELDGMIKELDLDLLLVEVIRSFQNSLEKIEEINQLIQTAKDR
ncbi:hypothetical protein [Terasakiella sp. SH-1]|uniref:hypothetical protein n=1 Tax=Terasakiella sp. SH-1 TaxID=2560057 RepID=UPI0010736C19|nr:hypothetical protein [Terasakiella sp. SH-1]